MSTQSDNQEKNIHDNYYSNCPNELNEMKLFKQMLKVSAFYLEKQKSFIPKKRLKK